MVNEKLLKATLARAPRGGLRVFAYGSLMWNPGFAHTSARLARARGYCRRLAVWSTVYRGTAARPGLVFGLDRGGSCVGVLYRVAAANNKKVMRYLFEREMINDIYAPRFVCVAAADGKRARAISFVVCRQSAQYAAPMPPAAAAKIIAGARGIGGKNADYIINSERRLREQGAPCPRLAALCRNIAALRAKAAKGVK